MNGDGPLGLGVGWAHKSLLEVQGPARQIAFLGLLTIFGFLFKVSSVVWTR